ncbi:MAG: hypothetical protein AAFY73_09170 [Pseudomonadota bacterium]
MSLHSNKARTITAAAAFLWAGAVIGGSLIAAPAKFQVADLTLPVALQIGQVTFRWLVVVELTMAIVMCLALTFGFLNRKLHWRSLLLPSLAVLLLAVQWIGVMPLLTERTTAIISGEAVPSSHLHLVYVFLELAKIAVLTTNGFLYLKSVGHTE